MEIALSSKLKLGFVDGSHSKPVSTSPLVSYWNRCNHMVISWLFKSISPEIHSSVVYMSIAKQIWEELEMRYAQSNLPNYLVLEKRFLKCLKV